MYDVFMVFPGDTLEAYPPYTVVETARTVAYINLPNTINLTECERLSREELADWLERVLLDVKASQQQVSRNAIVILRDREAHPI